MALKDWLGKMGSAASKGASSGGAAKSAELTIDDLITLERYDEAVSRLKKRIKSNSKDYRSRIQLADAYLKTEQSAEAINEYLSVADRYAAEGFFDKANALVAKLSRMIPHEDKLIAKMEGLKRSKKLEHRRKIVTDSLRGKSWAFEIRQNWSDLVKGPLIEMLTREQLVKIFPLFSFERFKEQQVLVERRENRPELFVLVSGTVAAELVLPAGNTADLRTFNGGDMIGDRALLRQEPWAATYRAKTSTLALVLGREGLAQTLVGEEDPRGLLNILRVQGFDEVIAQAVGKVKVAESE